MLANNDSLKIGGLNLEELTKQVLTFKGENNMRLINKYSMEYFMAYLEKEKIASLEEILSKYGPKGVGIIDFVKIFLQFLPHSDNETLYLVMALVEFFMHISETNESNQYVKVSDITSYICDVIDFLIFF